MKIRHANKFDFPQILAMLHTFKYEGPSNFGNAFNNEEYVATLYAHIMAGRGIVLVAEKDDLLIGMIIAMIDNVIWDPDTRIMRELCYWVDKEYRGSSAGYRLLKEYTKVGDKLIEEGRITTYAIAKLANSPDLKFDKFGFKKAEEIWVAE